MAEDRRKLTTRDYDNFEVNDAGELFWKGKKLATRDWARSEKIALASTAAAAIAVIFTFLINLTTFKGLLCGAYPFPFVCTPSPQAKEGPQH